MHRAAERERIQRERAALDHWRRLLRKVVLHQQLQARHAASAAVERAPVATSNNVGSTLPAGAVDQPEIAGTHTHVWMEGMDVMSGDTVEQCECGARRAFSPRVAPPSKRAKLSKASVGLPPS